MDRDHRLEFEYILRAVMRPKAEVGVVLEGQDGEVANRILRFLRDIRRIGLADGVVVDARASRLVVVGRRRLLGVRGRTCDEKSGSKSREHGFHVDPCTRFCAAVGSQETHEFTSIVALFAINRHELPGDPGNVSRMTAPYSTCTSGRASKPRDCTATRSLVARRIGAQNNVETPRLGCRQPIGFLVLPDSCSGGTTSSCRPCS